MIDDTDDIAMTWLVSNTKAIEKKTPEALARWAKENRIIEDLHWGQMKNAEYPKLSEEEIDKRYDEIRWDEVYAFIRERNG